ncbi:hypothetical protein IZT61_09725 [Pedobacter endophyticus]|uniref:Uncharacterized protein n=2 Tax=Pedobacter endophyticus TaxID=2789740 RepID=A0A7S9L3K2_9SPHI|nr:hypothetical protein IZT61_09725 [Pedobacter endophyticus]
MANAQVVPKTKLSRQTVNKQMAEVACGECQFKMKGKDCDLAVRINGKSYFVDGKGIDDFGDAHSEHGFCNAISKARVTGEIVNGRFKAKEIELVKN